MKTLLVLLAIALLGVACHHGDDSAARAICDDLYDHTNACLVTLDCSIPLDHDTYVDECLTDEYTAAERDAFVASPCDEVNASSCFSDTTFYRDSCNCGPYTDCSSGLDCESIDDDDAACLDQGDIPQDAVACASPDACPAGYLCAVTTEGSTDGFCVQACIP